MTIAFRNLVVSAALAIVCLCACNPTGPDADTVLSVSYNTSGEAPLRTLTVTSSQVRFESDLNGIPSLYYDTTVADANFINEVRSHIELSEVLVLGDRMDYDKLAIDELLHTLSITYQHKGELTQSTKVINYTEPAHDELTGLHVILSAKAKALRR